MFLLQKPLCGFLFKKAGGWKPLNKHILYKYSRLESDAVLIGKVTVVSENLAASTKSTLK
jgi:hypothetical protein